MPSRTLYIIYPVFCRLCMRCGAWYWSIQFVDVLYAAWLMQLSLQSLGRKETPTSDGNYMNVHVHVATAITPVKVLEREVDLPRTWLSPILGNYGGMCCVCTRGSKDCSMFTGGPSSSMYMYSASLQSHTAIDLIEVNRE